MYTELIQRCKQMYLTESDGGDDDNFYQLPSFLDSIASVLIHLDKVTNSFLPGITDVEQYLCVPRCLPVARNDFLTGPCALLPCCQIPEVYTPLLERLLVVQIDSFPQYSERMQTVCCRSILKVLVAMASKGPVLWSFISSVGMLIMSTLVLQSSTGYDVCCRGQTAVDNL